MTTLLIIALIAPVATSGTHLLSAAYPSIVVAMIMSPTPKTECSMIKRMAIAISVITMNKVYTIMGTYIRMITHGSAIIIETKICIMRIDTHAPTIPHHIYRTIEIVTLHKTAILTITQHIHQVLIAHIEQVIIIVYRIIVSVHDIVNNLIHLIEEVKVNLIHILILAIAESQLMSHTVGKETCLTTDITHVHRRPTVGTDSCQSYKH